MERPSRQHSKYWINSFEFDQSKYWVDLEQYADHTESQLKESKNKIKDLDYELVSSNRAYDSLEKRKDEEIEKLQSQLKERDKEIEVYQIQVSNLQAEIQELL